MSCEISTDTIAVSPGSKFIVSGIMSGPKRSQQGDCWIFTWHGPEASFQKVLKLLELHKSKTRACSTVAPLTNRTLSLKWTQVSKYNSVSSWLNSALQTLTTWEVAVAHEAITVTEHIEVDAMKWHQC